MAAPGNLSQLLSPYRRQILQRLAAAGRPLDRVQADDAPRKALPLLVRLGLVKMNAAPCVTYEITPFGRTFIEPAAAAQAAE